MKPTCRVSLNLAILFLSILQPVSGQDHEWEPVAEEVVIVPAGPFGERLSNCKVTEFLTRDKDRPLDRRYRFTGLVGSNIPFGTYVITLRCDVPQGVRSVVGGVSSLLEVKHKRDFLVVSSHRWLGDHAPGGGPRFRVNVRRPTADSDRMWIKMVGLYLNKVFVDGVDEMASSGEIIDAMPGDYMLMLLVPGRLVCEKQIRLLDPGGSLTLDLERACDIVEAIGAKELERVEH
jgi:hypothetical protein